MQLKSDDGRIVNNMVYSSEVLAKGDNIIVVYSNMTAGRMDIKTMCSIMIQGYAN
ncbi:hypothetical protein ABVC73_04250 [Prevotella melaninogenica]